MADIIYWIWFSNACGTRFSVAEKLLTHFGSDPEKIFKADDDEIMSLFDRRTKNTFSRELDEAYAIKDYCIRNNIGLLPLENEYYPERLKKIKDRPLLLYYRGVLPDFDNRLCIAAVGTRRMTEYGQRSAYTIAYDLAKCGAVVVSGMALGVDGMCHRAALDAGGRTVAILGCGIDRVYPPEHESLMREIIAHGTIITEFKPSAPPSGANFPIRNRIISGLCQGTFIIEADNRSGAMITARNAIYQGRDIYALPGKVGELGSGGTNGLIQNGAKMVTTALDILEDYAGLYPTTIRLEKYTYRSPERELRPALIKNAGGVNNKNGAKRKNAAPPPSRGGSVQIKELKSEPEPRPEKNFYIEPSKTPSVVIADIRSGRGERAAAAFDNDYNENKFVGGTNENKSVGEIDVKTSEKIKITGPGNGADKDKKEKVEKIEISLDENEKYIYGLLPENTAVTADFLSRKGIPISQIMTVMTMLELKGRVAVLPGGRYKKI